MIGRLSLGVAAVVLLVAQMGCATTAAPPPQELRDARMALERAQLSPLAPLAPSELADAEAALATAERDAADAPGSLVARDSAYVAARAAERARIAGLYGADRAALDAAKRSVSTLRTNVPRKRAADDERAQRAGEDRVAREAFESRDQSK